MNPIASTFVILVCLFVAALAGMRIRDMLPERRVDDDSKHTFDLSLGIIGTMAGLVLGLLVAQAVGTYNSQSNELNTISAKCVFLDRVLDHYGSNAHTARVALRLAIAQTLNQIWPKKSDSAIKLDPGRSSGVLYDRVEALVPENDAQRSLKGEAISLLNDIMQTRWLMFEQLSTSFSFPLLVVVVFWFVITFVGIGLSAPRNPMVIGALFCCALAVSGAVFLVQEMSTPFQGAIRLSSAPLRDVLIELGQ